MSVQFGEPFLWGVATSGYQAEGGFNGPGDPKNNWAWAEQAGDVASTGLSADFWHLYEEDFARCKALGLNAFRLSLEWSRIQPGTELGSKKGLASEAPSPAFDDEALHGYAQRLASCLSHGLEPLITLHHFVQPAWLGLDAWLSTRTIERYLAYVDHSIRYLLRVLPLEFGCRPPRWFITINEPNLFAFNHYLYRLFPSDALGVEPTVKCLCHVLEAHVRTYRLIHRLYAQAREVALEPFQVVPSIGFNNYASDLYWCDSALIDLVFAAARGVPRDKVNDYLSRCAREFDDRFDQARLLPVRGPRYFLGKLLKRLHHWVARRKFRSAYWTRLIDVIYEKEAETPLSERGDEEGVLPSSSPFSPGSVPLDFIAFDYYDPFIAHALRWPTWEDFELRKRSFRDWVLESVASKWWDWRLLPEGLSFFAHQFASYGLPVIIAENGMALRQLSDNRWYRRRDKLTRSHYLREHVRVVSRLVEQGVPLKGYFHWSLFDNYEWGSFAPRFGLFSLDYTVYPDRQAVDLSGDNASATYAHEIAEANLRFARVAALSQRGQNTGNSNEGTGPHHGSNRLGPPLAAASESSLTSTSSL